jgi:hypothetical protein
MATDYDAPRRSEADELAEDSLEELKARRNENQSGIVDVDTDAPDENFELPGADLSGLSGDELTVKVLPKQADEFTCSRCFLVHHRSRLAEERNGQRICQDLQQSAPGLQRGDQPRWGPGADQPIGN